MGGVIVFWFTNGDWTWSNTYCKVPAGLTDPACDVIVSGLKFEAKDWS